MRWLSLLFIAVLILPHAQAEDLPGHDKRRKDVIRNCLRSVIASPNTPSSSEYKDRSCTYFENVGPLSRYFSGRAAFFRTGDWLAEALVAGAGSLVPDVCKDGTNWDQQLQKMYYESIKRMIKIISDNDGLKDCQKACLATCISSEIISYKKSFNPAVSTQEGNCSNFSYIAVDLAQSMGLNASAVSGTLTNDASLAGFGVDSVGHGHVMMSVSLEEPLHSGKKKTYLIEPQLPSCTFYNDSDKPRTGGKDKTSWLQGT